MDRADTSSNSPLRLILAILLAVVLPLALGLYLAPRLVPVPQIGVIRLNYDIFDLTAREMIAQLEYARDEESIRAVVIVLNSPGGSATYSEELFLNVLDTREHVPVVATVDVVAASGAYYVAVAADEIYAKPTSAVGSIGVIGLLPGPVYIDDETLTTGPFKAFGGTQDAMIRQAERSKFAFLEAIRAGRGERLQVDLDVLARAEIYNGLQAVEMGLVDGIRANAAVFERAAELAGLVDYEIVELFPLAVGDDETLTAAQLPPLDVQRLWAPPTNYPPGLYYRYVRPQEP